jgi:acetyl-CoA decarbonylase/synthase complex subunit delta
MAFEINKVKYTGKINVTPLGVKNVLLGGQAAYPFHDFEGALPNKPKLGLQVWDIDPGESFAGPLAEAFAGVLGDPGAWAKKCVEYGADIVSFHLKSSDPNDKDTGPDEAMANVGKVLDAVDVPVIVFGVDNPDKDKDTLSAVAEKFSGKKLILGPVTDKNYKQVGAQALAYGHSVIARSPIDVNLAKQLNILLMDLGITPDRILIDPNTGGIGYGMEYCYSVMERINMAALLQQDDKLQQPIINILGEEIWKLKEVNQLTSEHPTLGDQLSRGVLMEVTEAVSLLSAGSSVLIMAHPTSLKLAREYIDLVSDGGAPTQAVALEVPVTDLSSVAAPAAGEKKPAEEKKAEAAPAAPAAEKKAEPAPAPAAEKKAEPVPAPAPEKKPEPAPAPAVEKKAVPAPAPAPEKKPEPAPKPAAEAAPAPKPEPKPVPVPSEPLKAKPKPSPVKVALSTAGGKPMTAEQAKSLEKPEEAISNQIISELDRVHMRIPRY